MRSVRLPPYTIVTPLEQWSNGYFVTVFEFAGLRWRLMNSDGKREAPHTYLKYDEQPGDKLWEAQHRWIKDMRWQIPTFADMLTVEAAVAVLSTFHSFYSHGVAHGYADAQHDIRKALGVS